MQRIPNYVNDPNIMLLWTVDELIPVLTMITIGFFSDNLTISLVCSWGFLKYYRKHRDAHHRGYLKHWVYWQGLMPIKSRVMENPFVKRLIP
jgi:conjugal transfer pilus assembly protein TraL